MRYFDDQNEYWGDKAEKIIDEGRLTSKSVKMFADGRAVSELCAIYTHTCRYARRVAVRLCSGESMHC
jgi:hypothetical protein